jgi:hypothetical protein
MLAQKCFCLLIVSLPMPICRIGETGDVSAKQMVVGTSSAGAHLGSGELDEDRADQG